MARFSEQFLQHVAQATDIVELIGQYVPLKKKGKEFAGLCPFHDDHSPSMYVSPAKQMFKCFVCGAGGGAYNFLMMYEKVPFPEAVKLLAEQANIPLPAEAGPRNGRGAEGGNLRGALEFAAGFYRRHLAGPAGTAALQYARERGFTDESIEQFGLGFAPGEWEALNRAARREGYSEKTLLEAGLVAQRERGGCYDRFRNRLIFPIHDAMGRLIAFGGRALDPEDRAKYLNSPETSLYDKSGQLFALNLARTAIASAGLAIVVEGYLDALMPIQAGVANVVATLGTALTERHVRLLGRYAKQAVLVFDADTAGAAAAERALEVFLAQRLHVRVATIPAGKDPCDYVLAEGGEKFRELIDQAPDALQYVWERRLAAFRESGANLADRRALIEDFLRLVVSSAAYGSIDEIRRGQLAQHIAHLLNIPSADVGAQMRRIARQVKVQRASAGPLAAAAPSPPPGTERQIIEVLLAEPELFDEVVERVDPADFADPALRRIAEEIWRRGLDGQFHPEELPACEALVPLAGLLAELAAEGDRRGNGAQTLRGAVEQIAYRRYRREIEQRKADRLDAETLRRIASRVRDVRRLPRIR